MTSFPSWCTEHRREVTQDHLLYYDRLNSLYGQQILNMLCVCQAIYTFKDQSIIRGYDNELSLRKKKEMLEELEFERTKKKEEKLDSAGRWYFITFTRPDTQKDPGPVMKSTERLLKSKQVSAVQWCYSLELTEAGTPHTHIRLFSNKYFDYKKVGNFNDGFRYDVQQEKFTCANYVIKEASKPDPKWLELYGLTAYYYCSGNYSGPSPSSSESSPETISLA